RDSQSKNALDVALEAPLITLLQKSAAASQQWAFLAATLLETLWDHFHGPPYRPGAEALLPHTLSPAQEDWLDSDLGEVLSNNGLPLDLRTRLANLRLWHEAGRPPPDRLLVYTDGSATTGSHDVQPCAWAFAVFGVCGFDTFLIGHASAAARPPGTEFYLGECIDDALTAELLALCWALSWAAQFAEIYQVTTTFLYDSLAAGEGTFGAAALVSGAHPEFYQELAKFAVVLRQYVEARTKIAHDHVQGHSGELGNDLVDSLAKTARRVSAPDDQLVLPSWPAALAAHPLREWAWACAPGLKDVPCPFNFEVEAQLAQEHFRRPSVAPLFGLECKELPVQADALSGFPKLNLMVKVQVIHAPSAASVPVADLTSFWSARLHELNTRPAGADFILLCDANARLGSVATEAVGAHHCEEENVAGTLFHDFLSRAQAWVPATFAGIHQGASGTWRSPQGQWFRLDYVVVPIGWLDFTFSTEVLYAVETLQKKDDHVPQVPWHVDVDAHYAQLSSSWRWQARGLTERSAPEPRQPFLTDSTLGLIAFRTALRHYLRTEAAERSRRWLFIGFAAFVLARDQNAFTSGALRSADEWLWDLDVSEARALSALYVSSRTIRQSVIQDRCQYLEGLASQAAAKDLRDSRTLYQSIRRAFPAAQSSRRRGPKPLPSLVCDDGTPAQTFAQRNECWRAHFAAQEAGIKVSPDEYIEHFASYAQRTPWAMDIQAVPTLLQVERHIRSLQRGKAAGADEITAEFLRLDAPVTSRQLLPVLLKASLRAVEPVVFRGGELFLLAKRASALLGCDGYRSILVSSVPGKVYHRCLRHQILPAFVSQKAVYQGGIQPGQGIELISLVAKTFFGHANAQGQVAALIFFDLKAAFYQVLRQTLVGTCDSDVALRRLFHALHIPPTALKELKQHLECASLLADAGVSSHSQALITDLFEGTYFRLSTSAVITLTQRGSRPGDPMADILFAFTLSALTRALQETLSGQGLLAEWKQPSNRPSFIPYEGQLDLGCPSWADDFFLPQTAPNFASLVDKVTRSVALLEERAVVAGMTIKYGPEKTAVLLPAELLARHSTLLATHEGCSGLWIPGPFQGVSTFLPAVQAYRHLGGILTSDINPTPDLHLRYSQAMGVIKPLRRRLFGALKFDIKVRSNLLRSLAVSRYVHSSASLMLPAAIHRRLWERQYLSLWRPLVARTAADMQAHNYEILRVAQAPSPPLALAKARAGCLAKLFLKGPVELLALLWDHWVQAPKKSWLGQLQDDHAVVAAHVPEINNCLHSSCAVQGILEAYAEDAQWWGKQVNKAVKTFLQDLEVWKQERRERPRQQALRAAQASAAFSCYLCDASFPLRKHLHAHLARTHQVYSPARHYAIGPACSACLRLFPDVVQAQQHLKVSGQCLQRCLYLHPPLTLEEIRILEADRQAQVKRIKQGGWSTYVAKGPPRRNPVVFGPRMPTAEDRLTGAVEDESDMVASLVRPFTPKASHVVWVTDFLQGKSKEGTRASARSFWAQRPSFHSRIQ
ncbi:unnamed protein product, partial [Symbiodinium necroappetens]